MNKIVESCHARIGLMGNPSDGFGGKTVSVLLRNFCATVTMEACDKVVILPHPILDLNEFEGLDVLLERTTIEGLYGGTRLLLATCKAFTQRCKASGLISRLGKGFRLSYDTNIPRMVGLSGSSAIIVAAFKALLRYYEITLSELNLTMPELPSFILEIETKELGISAGLQDRVIQTYGGMVHMDFSPGATGVSALNNNNNLSIHDRYTPLDVSLLPEMYLAYNTANGGESGKVHSTVKERWARKDPELSQGMVTLGELADAAVQCLETRDVAGLAILVDKNFALRRQLYGDAVVGHKNIAVAELIHQKLNMSAKFTGSGGAFLLVRRDGGGWLETVEENNARDLLANEGFRLVRIEAGPSQVWPI
eukprot:gene1241-2408_t